jgi:hypothetical protein
MRFYFATLGPGSPKGALGLYEHGTARCLFYSEGTGGDAEWFFDMGTGRPTFYVSEGAAYLANGSPLNLGVDLPRAEYWADRMASENREETIRSKARVMIRGRHAHSIE